MFHLPSVGGLNHDHRQPRAVAKGAGVVKITISIQGEEMVVCYGVLVQVREIKDIPWEDMEKKFGVEK